jgi:predicted small secreted protein
LAAGQPEFRLTQNHPSIPTLVPMIKRFSRRALFLSLTTLLSLLGLGCHTANGFGKDMEKAGEKIQDGTK